jgi:hypothetical protein
MSVSFKRLVISTMQGDSPSLYIVTYLRMFVTAVIQCALSAYSMALGSTQPLTEMSTRNLPGGKKRPARRADNLAAIYELQPLSILRGYTACTGKTLPYKYKMHIQEGRHVL